MSKPRYVYVWEFEVAPGQQAQFLHHYGPDGEWAALFRRSPAYLGTLLLQDQGDAARYLTIDRWRSAEAHEAFLAECREDYERLDRLCEAFTSRESSLGSYWECLGD